MSVLMMASLLRRLAVARADVTVDRRPSTPASMPTSREQLTVSPSTLSFDFQVVLPPDGVASKPQNIMLSVAKNQPQPVTIELPMMVSDQNRDAAAVHRSGQQLLR